MENNNNVIMHKKSEIKSRFKDFREIIKTYGFKYNKNIKTLRKALRSDEKAADDKKKDDAEYLQGIINRLNNLKNSISNKIDIMIKTLNIMELKQLNICLIISIMITDYIQSITNNINHFLMEFYYHLMNI